MFIRKLQKMKPKVEQSYKQHKQQTMRLNLYRTWYLASIALILIKFLVYHARRLSLKSRDLAI